MGATPPIFSRSAIVHAARTLNLSTDLQFTAQDVRTNWKKLIERVHPDVGGSSYFAEEVNSARDLLLDWISAGRRIETEERGASHGPDPVKPAPEKQQQNGSPFVSTVRGVSRFVKEGFKIVFGLLIWVLIIKGGYNWLTSKGSGTLNEGWQYSEEKENNGVWHFLAKHIIQESNSEARIIIGCYTSGIAPARDFRVFIYASGLLLKEVSFRRTDTSTVSRANISADSTTAGIRVLNTIEGMSDKERSDAFGIASLFLVGKWLLAGSSNQETQDDVLSITKSYYAPVFSTSSMLINIKYVVGSKEYNLQNEYKFSDMDDKRAQFFRSCYIHDPYIIASR